MTFISAVLRRTMAGAAAGAFLALASCALGDYSLGSSAAPAQAQDQRLIGRVVERSYRAIADRYIDPPDFRNFTGQALRAVAAVDGSLDVEETDRGVRVLRRGSVVVEKPMPGAPSDPRAWASLFSDVADSMIVASPALIGADQDRLIRVAMEAITRQLDRNSRYSDPEEARDNRFMRDGAGGIGITLKPDSETPVVETVQEGGPADRAGVHAGDRIVSVNGKPIGQLQLREIVRDVRGPIGEAVVLVLRRPSENRDIEFRIVRDKVIPTTVTVKRRGDLLHVQLAGFNTATVDNLRKALRRARDENGGQLAGVILDMRNNPGGLLDQAVAVSELFLDGGLIATTNGRHPDSRQTFRSGNGADFAGVPLVAVINGRSASAAEIVGAALQERGRAVVVGSVSYGKGSVQTVLRLPNGGELTLTWSRLFGPSGVTWNEVGVLPAVCASRYGSAADLDRQLDGAIANWREANARWHKAHNPSALEVQQLRALCVPVAEVADRELQLAERILRDRQIYARWVRASTESVAERR